MYNILMASLLSWSEGALVIKIVEHAN